MIRERNRDLSTLETLDNRQGHLQETLVADATIGRGIALEYFRGLAATITV